MNCLDCQALLQRRLDGDGPVVLPPGLADHLEACSDCRQLHVAATRLGEGLRLLTSPLPPPGLSRRIVTRALADRRRRRVRRVVMSSALAASLLFVTVISYFQKPLPPSPVVKRPDPNLPSLQNQVKEAGSAVVALTQWAADESIGESRMLLPRALPSGPRTLRPTDPAGQQLHEVGEAVTAGLEPVTNSARRAVQLFMRDSSRPARERRSGS